MPYAEPAAQSLPFQSDPRDRVGNTSRLGALAIAPDAQTLQARYVRLLYARGLTGATDQEAADALGIDRTTLIPRRAELQAHVKATGETRVRTGCHKQVPNKVYALAVFVDGVAPIDARRTA